MVTKHLRLMYVCVCVFGQIAAEVSAPLSKTDEIVLLGDDRATSEVSRLLASVPPSVQALTGVDISKVGIYFQFLSFFSSLYLLTLHSPFFCFSFHSS